MTAATLVADLRAAGIRLAVAGDRVVARGHRLPADLADRLRQHKDELVALLRAEGARRPPSTQEERLRAAYDGLTPEERAHLDAEAAAGDMLARLVLESLTEPPDVQTPLAVEETAVSVTRALAEDGSGWVTVWSRVLDTEVVFIRDQAVDVPAEHADLPTFTLAELAVLAAQRPDGEALRAIVQAKRDIGARVVADTGEVMAASDVFPMAPARRPGARGRR